MQEHQVIEQQGFYSLTDAANLLKENRRLVRNWTFGYSAGWRGRGTREEYPPVLTPQHPDSTDYPLGFYNLIELRFLFSFRKKDQSLQKLRKLYETIQSFLQLDYPYTSKSFYTDDGGQIYVRLIEKIKSYAGDAHEAEELLNLFNMQYEMWPVVRPYLSLGLEYENDRVVRWYPMREEAPAVVIDPKLNHGMPTIENTHVPTWVLFDTWQRHQDLQYTSWWHKVPEEKVRQAKLYEEHLRKVA